MQKDGTVYTVDDQSIKVLTRPLHMYHETYTYEDDSKFYSINEIIYVENDCESIDLYYPFYKYEYVKTYPNEVLFIMSDQDMYLYDLESSHIKIITPITDYELNAIGKNELIGFLYYPKGVDFMPYENNQTGYYIIKDHKATYPANDEQFVFCDVGYDIDREILITVCQNSKDYDKTHLAPIIKVIDEYGNEIDMFKDGYLTQIGQSDFYYRLNYLIDVYGYSTLFNKDGKLIFDERYFAYPRIQFSALNNGNLIIADGEENQKHYTEYDINGNKVGQSKDYRNVFFIDDYIVIIDENRTLKLLDLDQNEVATLWDDVGEGYVYDYRSASSNKDGEYAIYIVIGDDSITCEEYQKDHPGEETYENESFNYEYIYYPKTKQVKRSTVVAGGDLKPVIYLYPESDNIPVTATFNHPNLLTTTYPKYHDSWNVVANTNGDLYDQDGKYYYGLYFEEEANYPVDFSEGFYVTKDNAIDFLEDKLSMIGLTPRERNEMIMYWLPILENNGQSVVKFEFTQDRQVYNGIHIDPKPDSMLRVLIHVKKVNEKVDITPQQLPHFERDGFTVVEWGGRKH